MEYGRKSYKINDEIILIQSLRHIGVFRLSECQLPFHNTVIFKSKHFHQSRYKGEPDQYLNLR